MVHVKKVAPEYFEPLQDGSKRFELRREEPGEPRYAVGDYLALNEYDPARHVSPTDQYTGRCLLFLIRYVLRDFECLAPDCVALSLLPINMDMAKLNAFVCN